MASKDDEGRPQQQQQQRKESWIEYFLGGPISTFADRQRLERLERCFELDNVLKTCQQRRKAGQPIFQDDAVIEDTQIGPRFLLYYGWRDLAAEYPSTAGDTAYGDKEQEQEEQQQQQQAFVNQYGIPTCAREMHSVWGCRAVALKCGAELVELKRCFAEIDKNQVVSVSQTNYEGKSENSTISDGSSDMAFVPCRELQKNVGECVLKNAALLEERLSSAKK